ncbi:DNA-binding response regulator [Nocardioides sp. dk4132]|uniref:response regulator transcription factor n=1 Tax=unclassified Nocardioides TaxID=2615069 RepID=UPI00129734A8|nr:MULTISPECIES: response regulator transcription factor [unclassified Nocardioides]MQW75399.1 DNA-binding response regulator [Nocardioides sp. dk4132]QGA08325.1 DNA-binding response regulator [Nocardioides sp. dk884]
MPPAEPAGLPRPALRLGVLDETELVVTGLDGMLRPHRGRVELSVLEAPESTAGLDVVLCDPFRGGGDPHDHVARVAALGPARVLVYTWNTRAANTRTFVAAGAHAVLDKAVPATELISVVEAVGRGEPVLSAPPTGTIPLSLRESEVLTLLCRGQSNQEIADALYVSINSVKTYVRQIYRKLGVTRRTQAVAWANRHGHPC